MATLEQKEAAIEAVAQALGLISRKISPQEWNDDNKRLVQMRKFLYGHYPEEIDFDEMITELKEIINRYRTLPEEE